MTETFKTAPRTQQEIELTDIARKMLPGSGVSVQYGDHTLNVMVGIKFTNSVAVDPANPPAAFEYAVQYATEDLVQGIRKAVGEPRNTERQQWSQDRFGAAALIIQTRDDGTSVINTQVLENLLHMAHHERF